MKPQITTAQRIDRSISESQLQDFVCDAAARFGWWYFHDSDSRRNAAGLPDCILIRPPRVIFAELKRELGRTSKAQDHVLDLLNLTDVETYLWRPSHMNEILEILK